MTKRKTNLIAPFAVAFSALGVLSLMAAEVSPTDPVPPGVNPGPPPTIEYGGIDYHWTVRMNAKDSASIQGTVGAWSWDEDARPDTSKGWTHTSNWVALELKEDCRLTIRLERKAGVPTSSDPNVNGEFNLFPGFTVYQGWNESGGVDHFYNNRGDVAWTSEIVYVDHFENDGTHVNEATLRLKAGKYSIALGGNSPSTSAEPVQGYGATFTTKSYYDPADVTIRGQRHRTKKPSFNLKGRITNPESLAAVQVSQGGRKLRAKVAGSSWSARVGKLKAGRNAVAVSASSLDGTVSKPKRAVIERIVPKPTNPEKRVLSWRGGTLIVPDASGNQSRWHR